MNVGSVGATAAAVGGTAADWFAPPRDDGGAPVEPAAVAGGSGRSGRARGVPPEVPPAALAVSLGETALRHVLAAGATTAQGSSAAAVELLRNVEALVRSSAPTGTSAAAIGKAAAQLVDRQGLLGRLGWPETADPDPSHVDTRL